MNELIQLAENENISPELSISVTMIGGEPRSDNSGWGGVPTMIGGKYHVQIWFDESCGYYHPKAYDTRDGAVALANKIIERVNEKGENYAIDFDLWETHPDIADPEGDYERHLENLGDAYSSL